MVNIDMSDLPSFKLLSSNNCTSLSSFSYGFGGYLTLEYLDLSYCSSLYSLDCSSNSISYLNLTGTPISTLISNNNNLNTNSLDNILKSLDDSGINSGYVNITTQNGGGCLDTTGQTYKLSLESKSWTVDADICP
jgi:hypothetical protein